MASQARTAWDRCLKGTSKKPRFKGSRNRLNAFSFQGDCKIDLTTGVARLPKLGKVRFKTYDVGEHLQDKKIAAHVTLKERADGWYVVIRIDAKHSQELQDTTSAIGIDPGFKSLITCSDGKALQAPKELEKSQKQLGKIQRGIQGLKARGSPKIAVKQLKIARQRKDRNHKISHDLVRDHAEIYWLDDSFKGMQKRFGKQIQSLSLGELRNFISYKSSSCSRVFKLVESRNSTVTCSACLALTGPKGWDGLNIRAWTCSACGKHHLRDENSSKNALRLGQGMPSIQRPPNGGR